MSSTTRTQTTSTPMAMTKKAWPLGSRIPRPDPLGLQVDSPGARDGLLGEDGVVEEEGGGDGHQGQAQARAGGPRRGPAPPPPGRRPAAPTRPPISMESPRWLASWAAVKAPTPGQGGLGQGQLTAHAGDQGDGEEDRRVDQPDVEHGLPRLGHPGEHRHDEGGQQHVPGDPDDPVHLRGPEGGGGRRRRRVHRGQRVLGAVERAEAGHDQQGGQQHDERQAR